MSRIYFLKQLGQSTPQPRKMAKFICERCGIEFEKEFWYIKKGRRFCSHECRKQDPMKTLMSRCIKREDGCWDWTGVLDMGGYGQLKIGNKHWLAHRLMWTLIHNKIIPEGIVIRHTCIGNRKCINPDHLLSGTQKDNIDDMRRQGRFRTPFMHDFRHIESDVVREIRTLRKPDVKGSRLKPTCKELAEMFKTRTSIIWQIVNFKTYKDIK